MISLCQLMSSPRSQVTDWERYKQYTQAAPAAIEKLAAYERYALCSDGF